MLICLRSAAQVLSKRPDDFSNNPDETSKRVQEVARQVCAIEMNSAAADRSRLPKAAGVDASSRITADVALWWQAAFPSTSRVTLKTFVKILKHQLTQTIPPAAKPQLPAWRESEYEPFLSEQLGCDEALVRWSCAKC